MRRFRILTAALCLYAGGAATAADNELTPKEKTDGWLLLFDGKTLNGWQTSSQRPSKRPVEDNCINPHKSGGYMMIHEKTWSDFLLAFDFKISKGCNSGVFVRTHPLKPRPGKDVGFNGIEIAIDDTKTAGFFDTGSIYDLVKPSKNVMKPVGDWNHMVITCDGPRISVELNGETVSRMNLDEWTEPNRRPDGSTERLQRLPRLARFVRHRSPALPERERGRAPVERDHVARSDARVRVVGRSAGAARPRVELWASSQSPCSAGRARRRSKYVPTRAGNHFSARATIAEQCDTAE